jgi:hypothetical protein
MAPFSLLVTLATLSLSLSGAHAWGELGHATIAFIAQNFLTPSTATWAQGVLNDSSSTYLASIASWADDFRSTAAGKFSAPFHFIDARDSPPAQCDVEFERDCGSTGCVVSALQNYTQRVGDGELSAVDVNQALMFIVHFVGDVTQPLHDEALESGGNGIAVTFQGFSDNLHSDWVSF